MLVEGKRVAVESLAEHPVMAVVGGVALGGSEDWPLPGGDPTRQRTGEDLPLDLPGDPYWHYGLQERDTRFVAIYGHWDVLAIGSLVIGVNLIADSIEKVTRT